MSELFYVTIIRDSPEVSRVITNIVNNDGSYRIDIYDGLCYGTPGERGKQRKNFKLTAKMAEKLKILGRLKRLGRIKIKTIRRITNPAFTRALEEKAFRNRAGEKLMALRAIKNIMGLGNVFWPMQKSDYSVDMARKFQCYFSAIFDLGRNTGLGQKRFERILRLRLDPMFKKVVVVMGDCSGHKRILVASYHKEVVYAWDLAISRDMKEEQHSIESLESRLKEIKFVNTITRGDDSVGKK